MRVGGRGILQYEVLADTTCNALDETAYLVEASGCMEGIGDRG